MLPFKLLQLITWWNGQTFGTWLHTKRFGVEVGRDQFGNVYYTDKPKKKRWVIFSKDSEASNVPPEWHGWLHYTYDEVPDANKKRPTWIKPHVPNMTGTSQAYYPRATLLTPDVKNRPSSTADYQAWKPE